MKLKRATKDEPKTEQKTAGPEFLRQIDRRFPGLTEKIRKTIEQSERDFSGSQLEDSFLWEHSLHVTYLAWKIAREEKEDAVLTGVVALLHDAGKFEDGLYHHGTKAEEEAAARVAEKLLPSARMEKDEKSRIVGALKSLYREKTEPDRLADIIHDADFLSKFGLVGVANFFIKSTLRGRNLHGAIMNHLSKELTYASFLPMNMRTEAGKVLATKKAEETIKFFKNLLDELQEIHGLSYQLRKVKLEIPEEYSAGRKPGSVKSAAGKGLSEKRKKRNLDVWLVMARDCDRCGGSWKIEKGWEKGIKCTQATFRVSCTSCPNKYRIAFCLPEILFSEKRRLP